jgi:hypothetical protein
MLVCSLLSAASAYAQEPSHPLVLTAHASAAGGTDLMAGKYAALRAQINGGAATPIRAWRLSLESCRVMWRRTRKGQGGILRRP